MKTTKFVRILGWGHGSYSEENRAWLADNIGKTFPCIRSTHNYVTFDNGFVCNVKDYGVVKVDNNDVVVLDGKQFQHEDLEKMYTNLVAIYHRSQMNGLVQVDTYDREMLKSLLKI